MRVCFEYEPKEPIVSLGIVHVGVAVGQCLRSVALHHEVISCLGERSVHSLLHFVLYPFNCSVSMEQSLLAYVPGEIVGPIFECQTM